MTLQEEGGSGKRSIEAYRLQDGAIQPWRDTVAQEEPMEIRLAGCSVAVTMRTPGHDYDLAAGFLYTEGIIRHRDAIASIRHCPDGDGNANIVNVNPSDPALVQPEQWARNFFATSSCGICGKASIDRVLQKTAALADGPTISAETILQLDSRLRSAQALFDETGGLHAAGLFDQTGRLTCLREDVGRHNAVDKVIGDALRRDVLPLHSSTLMVSGRTSFEIVQKAVMASIPIVAAVSAPSSLAVDFARASNLTLIGFLRKGRFNVYSGRERIMQGMGDNEAAHASTPAGVGVK